MSISQQGSTYQSRGGSAYQSHRSESTLHQEIGRFKLHQVSQETREAVENRAEMLEKQIHAHNMKIRKHFEDKFINRVKKFEQYRHKETKKWEIKTAKSPFRVNQLQADAELFEKIQTVRAERARLKRKEDIIGDMRGKPKHDVVSEDIIKRVESPSGKLALERRVTQEDLKVVQKEFRELDRMVFDEFLELERKFPLIRDRLSASREGLSTAGSLRGEFGVSTEGSFSQSSSAASRAQSSHQRQKQH